MTDNTPFEGLIRDVILLILKQIHVEDAFKLLRISKSTKKLLDNEVYWKPVLERLFSNDSIKRALSQLQNSVSFKTSHNRSRYLIKFLLNRSYSDDSLKCEFGIAFNYYCIDNWKDQLDDECYQIIRDTLCRYIRWLSFRPLTEFQDLVNSCIPKILAVGPGNFDFGKQLARNFKQLNSRFALLRTFIFYVVSFQCAFDSSGIGQDYILMVLDCIRCQVENPNNEFMNCIEPYAVLPPHPYFCRGFICSHRECRRRIEDTSPAGLAFWNTASFK